MGEKKPGPERVKPTPYFPPLAEQWLSSSAVWSSDYYWNHILSLATSIFYKSYNRWGKVRYGNSLLGKYNLLLYHSFEIISLFLQSCLKGKKKIVKYLFLLCCTSSEIQMYITRTFVSFFSPHLYCWSRLSLKLAKLRISKCKIAVNHFNCKALPTISCRFLHNLIWRKRNFFI